MSSTILNSLYDQIIIDGIQWFCCQYNPQECDIVEQSYEDILDHLRHHHNIGSIDSTNSVHQLVNSSVDNDVNGLDQMSSDSETIDALPIDNEVLGQMSGDNEAIDAFPMDNEVLDQMSSDNETIDALPIDNEVSNDSVNEYDSHLSTQSAKTSPNGSNGRQMANKSVAKGCGQPVDKRFFQLHELLDHNYMEVTDGLVIDNKSGHKKWYTCRWDPMCDFKTKNNRIISQHINYYHRNVRKFQCNYRRCGRQYATSYGLKIHEYNHRCGYGMKDKSPTNPCSRSAINRYLLKTKINGREVVYNCRYNDCQFKTYNASIMRDHIHRQHVCLVWIGRHESDINDNYRSETSHQMTKTSESNTKSAVSSGQTVVATNGSPDKMFHYECTECQYETNDYNEIMSHINDLRARRRHWVVITDLSLNQSNTGSTNQTIGQTSGRRRRESKSIDSIDTISTDKTRKSAKELKLLSQMKPHFHSIMDSNRRQITCNYCPFVAKNHSLELLYSHLRYKHQISL